MFWWEVQEPQRPRRRRRRRVFKQKASEARMYLFSCEYTLFLLFCSKAPWTPQINLEELSQYMLVSIGCSPGTLRLPNALLRPTCTPNCWDHTSLYTNTKRRWALRATCVLFLFMNRWIEFVKPCNHVKHICTDPPNITKPLHDYLPRRHQRPRKGTSLTSFEHLWAWASASQFTGSNINSAARLNEALGMPGVRVCVCVCSNISYEFLWYIMIFFANY